MSYSRLNNSSDNEDDAIHGNEHNSNNNHGYDSISTSPSSHIRRTSSSAAAASLASITRMSHPRIHEYSQLTNSSEVSSNDDDDESEKEDLKGSRKRPDVTEDTTLRGSMDRTIDNNNTDSENDIEIHVRFGEGQDLKLRVPRTDTIAQVKEKVKLAKESIGNKYLRLIHSGKILSDDKTLMESLPKSLFTHVELPHHSDLSDLQSKLSSSVEAVEVAASQLLAGISSRASGGGVGNKTTPGSVLPTHVSFSSTSSNMDDSTTTAATTEANTNIPNRKSSDENSQHVVIDMPSDPPTNSKHNNIPTTKIPVQTGPIYFLCSLSDFPPSQPSILKKGKTVATEIGGSNGTRRGGSSGSRSRFTSTTSAGVGSNGEGSSSTGARTRVQGVDGEDNEVEREGGEEGTVEDSAPVPPQATGFDRLREAGFSEGEIRSIRRQFHSSRGTLTMPVGENGIAVDVEQDEDARARARRIEEEWIDQHGSETLPEGMEASFGELVYGLTLGFFMGLIALFWFKEATFSRRQQMGIIAGLMINLGFGILHLYY